MRGVCLVCFSVLFLSAIFFGSTFAVAEPVNMLSLQEGALPVQVPASYGGWYPENVMDDSPGTGWACETGQINDNVFVFELAEETTLDRFEFDTAAIDTQKSGAKDVLVEVSTASAQGGFAPVLQATLSENADMQTFPAATKAPARWVRLTIRNNHGSEEWTELFSFRGFGEKPVPTTPANISGTYDSAVPCCRI